MQGKSPRQPNANDCGMYTALNGEHVCNQLIERLTTTAAPDLRSVSVGPTSQLQDPTLFGKRAASFTISDVKAFRALALACLSRIWLQALQVPSSDERCQIHVDATAALPDCLKTVPLWCESTLVQLPLCCKGT